LFGGHALVVYRKNVAKLFGDRLVRVTEDNAYSGWMVCFDGGMMWLVEAELTHVRPNANADKLEHRD